MPCPVWCSWWRQYFVTYSGCLLRIYQVRNLDLAPYYMVRVCACLHACAGMFIWTCICNHVAVFVVPQVIRLQYQCLHTLIASCYQSCDESGSLSMLRLSHVLRPYYDNLISRAVSEGSGTVFEGSGTVSAVGQFQKALGQCQQAVGQCQKTDNCVSTQQNSFRSQWDSVRRQQFTHARVPCIRPSQEKHANLQMHWICTQRFSLIAKLAK